MINKLRFLWSEIKGSLPFLIIVTVEIIVCTFLLNLAFSNLNSVTAYTRYYDESISSYSYVTTYNSTLPVDNNVAELKNHVNLDNLATTFSLGRIAEKEIINGKETELYRRYMKVFTPILWEKFNNYDFNKKPNKISDNYYEAYVFEYQYKVGETYTLKYRCSDSQIREINIKAIKYFDPNSYFYNFESNEGNIINTLGGLGVVICANPKDFDFASIESGIFADENPPSYYQSKGFNSKTVNELYKSHKELNNYSYTLYMYIAVIAMVFVVGSIIILYTININNMARKRTVNYISGLSTGKQLMYELIKMLGVFIVAALASYLVTAIVFLIFQSNEYFAYLKNPKFMFISIGLIFGVYLISLILGIIKYIKEDAIKIINNEH